MPQLFDFINSINKKNKLDDLQGYSQWMVNRFLCSDQQYVPFIAEINSNYNLTDKMHYDFLFHVFPKSNKFFKYNMKKEAKEKELEYVMKFFNVDVQEAKTYIQLISEVDMEEIRRFYEDRGSKGPKKKGKNK